MKNNYDVHSMTMFTKITTAKVILILCCICAFVLGMKQLREPDIWWLLLSGRWMIEHGSIMKSDVFTYTVPGAPWVNVKWLYEYIVALFEKLMGPETVILLQALVNSTIVFLLIKTAKASSEKLQRPATIFSIAISILSVLAISEYRMAGRPEMFSHLFSALYLFILWRNPNMEWKKIWWLIPLQCLWANMHDGYPVGIVIIGTTIGGSFVAFLISREKTYLNQSLRALILFAICILVLLVNPSTTQLWKQPFEIYRQVWANKYTTELYSYKDVGYWTMQAYAHWVAASIVFAYWIWQLIVSIRKRALKNFAAPITLTYLGILLLLNYLALTANRNIPFAQIAMFPSLAIAISSLGQHKWINSNGLFKSIERWSAGITITIIAVFYLSIVSDKWYKFTQSANRFGIHTSMLHNPIGAAAFMKQNKITGRAFSDYFGSSYLLWDGYPSFKSYIDLRDLEVFSMNFFDEYFSMYYSPNKFDTLDARYNFNYAVLSTSQLTALQMKLYWGEGYNMIYADPVSVIFLKNNEQNKPINSNLSIQKLFTWPEPAEDPTWATALNKLFNPLLEYTEEDESRQAIHASRFYNNVRNYNISLKLLKQQLASFEDDAEGYAALGDTYLQYATVLKDKEQSLKLDSASIYLEQAKQIDKNYVPVYLSLGHLNFMRGNVVGADENLDFFLKKDKTNDYAYFLQGLCNRSLWQNTGNDDNARKVITAMKASNKINPQNGKAFLYISEAELGLGRKDEAIAYMKKFIASGNPLLKEEQDLRDKLKKELNM